jgi:hypothetical protein
MSIRMLRWAITSSLAALLLTGYGCSGPDERDFGSPDASAGTSGAGSGGTSGTGGSSADSGTDAPVSCSASADCDDGNECNGSETCSAGRCAAGTQAGSGTPCTPQVADAGAISSDSGVEYVCDNGQCLRHCSTDAECDDGDVCTGNESCSPSTQTCQHGTPLACDDNDPCTDNTCEAGRGCVYPLTDADSDGHASTALGSCGDDCDDNDDTVFGGAAELCDRKDNNCNNMTDETAPRWYADCDGDGFAPTGAASIQQCDKPTAAPTTCGSSQTAGWTSVPPAAGTTDCWDQNPEARPRTADENGTAWKDAAITGAPVAIDFDYNCDGTEEKRYVGDSVSTTAACSFNCSGQLCFCGGPAGYTASTSAACGVSAQYTNCNILSCARTVSSVTQQCR